MSTYETLTRARAEVEKGWCRYLTDDFHGHVCALGAINIAAGRGDTRAYSDAVSQLAKALPADALTIAQFNDRLSTEKADVLALFDRALVAVADQAHDFEVVAS